MIRQDDLQTYFDFEKHGFDDINFIVHPKDFYVRGRPRSFPPTRRELTQHTILY